MVILKWFQLANQKWTTGVKITISTYSLSYLLFLWSILDRQAQNILILLLTACLMLDPAPALININLAEDQKNILLLINQQWTTRGNDYYKYL